MQHELQKHSSTNEGQAEHDDRKKYAKLTSEIKELFIQKIQASQLLRINYSSAKAIASTHKKLKAAKMKKGTTRRGTKTCEYRCLEENQSTGGITQVCSSIGGLITSEITVPKRKLIHKEYSSVYKLSPVQENPEIMQDC